MVIVLAWAINLRQPQDASQVTSPRAPLPTPPRVSSRRARSKALFEDAAATHGDLREAVTTLEDTERIAKRVLGGAHPLTVDIEDDLQEARDALDARGLP